MHTLAMNLPDSSVSGRIKRVHVSGETVEVNGRPALLRN
jgi:hypothetical protein